MLYNVAIMCPFLIQMESLFPVLYTAMETGDKTYFVDKGAILVYFWFP